MSPTPPVPITLVVARSYPLEADQAGPALEISRQLSRKGERVEVIAESPDEEEFIQLDPYGTLVHRVASARGYLRKLARPLARNRQSAFAIRVLEKALELQRLWNRAIVRVEVAGEPVEAVLLGALSLSPGLRQDRARHWRPCRSASLICPTYNRVSELVDSIESLLSAHSEARRAGVSCELLIVFQNEGTPAKVLAARPEWKDAPLRWIPSAPGLPRARNAGLLHACGDLLVFVDDDVVLEPNFVRGHLEAANGSPTSAGSAGRVRSRILGERAAVNRAIGQLRASAFVDTHFDSLTRTRIVPHSPIGANMAFKREAMDALFGQAWFDERLEGSAHREETTLCVELFRRGGHLVFAPGASLLHLEAEAGGCENRGQFSSRKEIDHLALDYLFFRRFFRDLGPFASLAPLSFLLRDVRQSGRPKLESLSLHLRGYHAGLGRYHLFDG
jgi:GT2 family glycosyltransferase